MPPYQNSVAAVVLLLLSPPFPAYLPPFLFLQYLELNVQPSTARQTTSVLLNISLALPNELFVTMGERGSW